MQLIAQQPWLSAAAIMVAAILLGYLARVFVIKGFAALLARTPTDLDDLVLASFSGHVPLWALFGGAVLSARVAPVSERAIQILDRLCAAGFALSLTFAIAKLSGSLLTRSTRQADAFIATTSLAHNVLRVAVFTCGILLVLANLGISITPLLTALGIGSLAVALALQPTLSNLFAGLHLAVARPIRVGDFVELESGTKGYVADIGWRATQIRELPNNIIVMPNARLADMIVTNFSLPEPEQAALVQVGVSYGSDLDQVERVTVDVGGEVLRQVQGGVVDFEPFIRYHTFGDSSINFTVILRVREFVDRFKLTHEFIKRLKTRYEREGIEIPFPQRVLHGTVATSMPAPFDAPARVVARSGW